MKDWRKKIHAVLEPGVTEGSLSRVYDIFMIVVIILCTIPLVVRESNEVFDVFDAIALAGRTKQKSPGRALNEQFPRLLSLRCRKFPSNSFFGGACLRRLRFPTSRQRRRVVRRKPYLFIRFADIPQKTLYMNAS